MIVLAYIGAIAGILNLWIIAGIMGFATRNWHPIQNLIKRIK